MIVFCEEKWSSTSINVYKKNNLTHDVEKITLTNDN